MTKIKALGFGLSLLLMSLGLIDPSVVSGQGGF